MALDLHRIYLVVGAVDASQQIMLTPRRFGFAAFWAWAPEHLSLSDAVVLEASTNAWEMHDRLVPLVANVTVAHSSTVKLLASVRIKTDARDTIKLAQLLAARLVPAVWVPPHDVREMRTLLAHRKRLVAQRTQAFNRLHGLLQRHNLEQPEHQRFLTTVSDSAWWSQLPLTPVETMQMQQDRRLLQTLQTLIEEADEQIHALSIQNPWIKRMPLLLQLPGFAVLNAMTVLAAIGNIQRFSTARQVVSYAGLAPSIHESGQTHRGGRITKEGRRDLRVALVEAAWMAVEHHSHWKEQFERLAHRIGKQKAIVAIARKLLVAIWHILSHEQADRHADRQAVRAPRCSHGFLGRASLQENIVLQGHERACCRIISGN
ncbi:IS110 family transposase [Ktedonobacter sp. SOSP1-52]|uniref:IS110 family transposase n=1 Tax=Ktedonobacter sp. SOSP1-52 TaxID=2778366 RepID=UPI001F3D8D8C|nr:IS110 family transposase [Ktedonobacter sp. SOSP1-52]